MDRDERAGWEHIGQLLDGAGRDEEQLELFSDKHSETAVKPDWAQVDLSGVQVQRVREFGKVYLGLALWRRLGLHLFFADHIRQGRERVDWATVACILAMGRFCSPSSELSLSEHWYGTTALDDLLGVDVCDVYDNRLYRGLDEILPLRDELFVHLRDRYRSMFGARFEFLLYDVTSTYFEGQCERNPSAQRGYSRDKRPDCKQVCIGLVVTPEGLPLAYEVFAGNRADVTTVEDIVELMEDKYGHAQRIWAMDRGMVSEDNLDYLRERGALYIVGTPKARLRKFEAQLLDVRNWTQIADSQVELKIITHPDGHGKEQYVMCRSTARHEKEAAMLRRQRERLQNKLAQMDASLKKRPQKAEIIERRIGKWLGRNTAAAKLTQVKVIAENGTAVGLNYSEDENKLAWATASQGAYLLRTNCSEKDPRKLWKWYIQLTEVEDAFRVGKSDLAMRPVFHQRKDRVESHIFICFLALAMWRTLEGWLTGCGLGDGARQVIQQMATIHSMDVLLPVKDRRDVCLRVVAKPEDLTADLLAHMKLRLPAKPKMNPKCSGDF